MTQKKQPPDITLAELVYGAMEHHPGCRDFSAKERARMLELVAGYVKKGTPLVLAMRPAFNEILQERK